MLEVHNRHSAGQKALSPLCAGTSTPCPPGGEALLSPAPHQPDAVTWAPPPAPLAGRAQAPTSTRAMQSASVVEAIAQVAFWPLCSLLLALTMLLGSHRAPHDPRARRLHLLRGLAGTQWSTGCEAPWKEPEGPWLSGVSSYFSLPQRQTDCSTRAGQPDAHRSCGSIIGGDMLLWGHLSTDLVHRRCSTFASHLPR